jgi:hypothetical protein
MSIQSINNGSLQLSDLIISNEKYSNSSGYAPSTATFSAGLTSTSIFVPAISAETMTIGTSPDVATIGCTNVGILSVPSLSVGGNETIANSLTVGPNIVDGTDYSFIKATNINIANSSNLEESVDLKCTTNDILSVPNLSVGGNATIDNSLTVGPNVVEGVNYSFLSSPSYTGGIYAYQTLSTRSVPANGTSTYTTSVPFNPFTGWSNLSTAACIPIVTPLCDYAMGIQSITITNTVGQPGFVDVAVLLYNAWSGAQNAYGINVLLFYQP